VPPVITLTTDFGWADPYVAAMKGVILSRLPGASVHDLSHEISPQDVFAGACFLAGAVPWFPPGTCHVAVVDPGVGTGRAPLAVRWRDQILVLPDNGLLTLLHRIEPVSAARRIEHPGCMLENMSATFHGRDVFAPAAAALAGGMPVASVGPVVEDFVLLPMPEPTSRPDGSVAGEIIHIDRFGNAVSNIPAALGPFRAAVVSGTRLPVLNAYADVPPGTPLTLEGSGGFLEIAVNQGSAADRFGLAAGSPMEALPD
jgi:S-adenosyl-L-methionine hydrolase (adenosine-forming)